MPADLAVNARLAALFDQLDAAVAAVLDHDGEAERAELASVVGDLDEFAAAADASADRSRAAVGLLQGLRLPRVGEDVFGGMTAGDGAVRMQGPSLKASIELVRAAHDAVTGGGFADRTALRACHDAVRAAR